MADLVVILSRKMNVFKKPFAQLSGDCSRPVEIEVSYWTGF